MPAQRTRRRRAVPDTSAIQQLGERIRAARTEAGLSQAQLGAPYYTRAHISAIELGKIRPAMKSLEHIAAKLSKPVSYFLEDAALERSRLELEFDVDKVVALAARPTATQCVNEAEALLEHEGLSARLLSRLRFARAKGLNYLERSAEAFRDLAVAERLAHQLHDESLIRLIDYETAAATRGTGDYRRARELFSDLLSGLEHSQPTDQPLRMRVLQALGAVSNDLGDPRAAAGYLNAALEWANEIGDVAVLIAIYHGLAMAYRAQGDLELATGYLRRALSASEIANDLTAAATVHNLLAVIAAESGRLQAAYQHADRAIELVRAAGPAAFIPHVLNTKAESAAKLGDWETAERVANESLALATRLENHWAIAAARVVLSNVLLHKGDTEAGERHLSEAAAVYRTAGAKSELADVLMRLSRAAKERGDLVAAERYATLAFETSHSVGSFVEGMK